MPLINYRTALTAYQRFQSVTCVSLNRHYVSSLPPLEYFTKLQEVADRWPSDACGRKMTLKDEIKRRGTELVSKPIQEIDTKFWEEEYRSLSRILNNHYRDIYRPPSVLGDSCTVPGGSVIAATGADLIECRRILYDREEENEKGVSLYRRLVDKLFN
ncbi:unnamed protein product [Schistosoma rodhaini]|uniref:Uncharacterized protein n=1 Tax=Schistosoma rodhaini TaxID=6188 RepID=A0A183QB32_9TREM|nr:unnamed protein product [Schistosoma rodhaini]